MIIQVINFKYTVLSFIGVLISLGETLQTAWLFFYVINAWLITPSMSITKYQNHIRKKSEVLSIFCVLCLFYMPWVLKCGQRLLGPVEYMISNYFHKNYICMVILNSMSERKTYFFFLVDSKRWTIVRI